MNETSVACDLVDRLLVIDTGVQCSTLKKLIVTEEDLGVIFVVENCKGCVHLLNLPKPFDLDNKDNCADLQRLHQCNVVICLCDLCSASSLMIIFSMLLSVKIPVNDILLHISRPSRKESYLILIKSQVDLLKIGLDQFGGNKEISLHTPRPSGPENWVLGVVCSCQRKSLPGHQDAPSWTIIYPEEGWPLGLQRLNVRAAGQLVRNRDMSAGSVSFSTLLTVSSSPSSCSSSDLDTQDMKWNRSAEHFAVQLDVSLAHSYQEGAKAIPNLHRYLINDFENSLLPSLQNLREKGRLFSDLIKCQTLISTESFYQDRSISLGNLIGISTILHISRISTRGNRPVSANTNSKKNINGRFTWLFTLCLKPACNDHTRTTDNKSLASFLEQERRETSFPCTRSQTLPTSDAPNPGLDNDRDADKELSSDNGIGKSDDNRLLEKYEYRARFLCACFFKQIRNRVLKSLRAEAVTEP
ncbi:hypothetical protein AKJ16_DCAP17919 [Drosera capensis]